jgi:hypothetical protein
MNPLDAGQARDEPRREPQMPISLSQFDLGVGGVLGTFWQVGCDAEIRVVGIDRAYWLEGQSPGMPPAAAHPPGYPMIFCSVRRLRFVVVAL